MRGRVAQWWGRVLWACLLQSLLAYCPVIGKRGVMIAPCSSKRPGQVQNDTAFLFRCEDRLSGCGRHVELCVSAGTVEQERARTH